MRDHGRPAEEQPQPDQAHRTRRADHPATFLRVIEVDPHTNAIVWEYADRSLFEFFSPYISAAQRLAREGAVRSDDQTAVRR